MLTLALLAVTLQEPDYRSASLEDVIRESYPANEWRLEGDRGILDIPLIIYGDSDLLTAAEWATGTELSVDEAAKKLTLKRDEAYWTTASQTAREARIKQIERDIAAKPKPPTEAQLSQLTDRLMREIGESDQSFYAALEELRKASAGYLTPLLEVIPTDWIADIPATGELVTLRMQGGQLDSQAVQSCTDALRKAQSHLMQQTDYFNRRGAELNTEEAKVHAMVAGQITDYFSGSALTTDPVNQLVVTGRQEVELTWLWIRAYSAAGTLVFQRTLTLRQPSDSDSLPAPLAAELSVQEGPSLTEEQSSALAYLKTKGIGTMTLPIWQSFSRPYSSPSLAPFVQPLRGKAGKFVAWCPDTFLTASPEPADGRIDAQRWQAASLMRPTGWHMSERDGWRALRPNDPADQLSRALAPEALHACLDSAVAGNGYATVRVLRLFRQYGRRVLANRHMQLAWRAMSSFADTPWPGLSGTEAAFAESNDIYNWFEAQEKTSSTAQIPVNLKAFTFAFPPGVETPTFADDPVNWPDRILAEFSWRPENAYLTMKNEIAWSGIRGTPNREFLRGYTRWATPSTQWGIVRHLQYEVKVDGEPMVFGHLRNEIVEGPTTYERMLEVLKDR